MFLIILSDKDVKATKKDGRTGNMFELRVAGMEDATL
jgi:hypothetical protein